MAVILSPRDGAIFEIVVFILAIIPTLTSRSGWVAALRIAAATLAGSIIGVGSLGSWSM
jgi:hypothetical protein